MKIKNMYISKTGHYLVASYLSSLEYDVILTDNSQHYNIIADISGRLWKIQTKTTSVSKRLPHRNNEIFGYYFRLEDCVKNIQANCGDDNLIIALVALDKNIIGFLPAIDAKTAIICKTRQHTYDWTTKGLYIEDLSLESAISKINAFNKKKLKL